MTSRRHPSIGRWKLTAGAFWRMDRPAPRCLQTTVSPIIGNSATIHSGRGAHHSRNFSQPVSHACHLHFELPARRASVGHLHLVSLAAATPSAAESSRAALRKHAQIQDRTFDPSQGDNKLLTKQERSHEPIMGRTVGVLWQPTHDLLQRHAFITVATRYGNRRPILR